MCVETSISRREVGGGGGCPPSSPPHLHPHHLHLAMEKPRGEKEHRSFKRKISRVFQRSKSSGGQAEEQEKVSQAGAGGGHRRRSWGSWRNKKSPELQEQSVPSTPVLFAEGRARHFSTDSFT